ncbi:hypothetical protein [Actinacidiphila sp. ITFR-21]|uniref:hypothetical protein n=1 Tax=Actinacidiphila sp. ITFR-21 TaxID=3075199 RepID=UPI00288C5F1B|nr:hypothetical protein [Streptomyces sp. ITFR-21]WNI15704.1 hypothetical protein RLT57_09305 [Streptomyces sp. ITFR-21]
MPRPTNAQVAYGLTTVVLFTFAVLLLTGARSGAAVTAVAAGGLLLGLLVAAGTAARDRRPAAPAPDPASATAVPRPRVRPGTADRRLSEESLRR